MRWVGNDINEFRIVNFELRIWERQKIRNSHFEIRNLKESFSRPQRAIRTHILQRKCEAKTALFTRSNVELAELEAQAVTVGIIANLSDRALEK